MLYLINKSAILRGQNYTQTHYFFKRSCKHSSTDDDPRI